MVLLFTLNADICLRDFPQDTLAISAHYIPDNSQIKLVIPYSYTPTSADSTPVDWYMVL